MVKKFSFSQITAGFVAVLVGYTSSVAIIFQAANALGATQAETSSWLLALGLGMGLTSIGLSAYYRMPILAAWSTPGAALLVGSLKGVSMPMAIGAFVFCGVLTILAGLTGWFEKMMARLPAELATAMLAGILLRFGINIFTAMQEQFLLVSLLFVCYLLGKQLFPRYTIIVVLLLGVIISAMLGWFHNNQLQLALSMPIFIKPEFSWSVLLSIGFPLFIVTMTSQNVPGIAVLRAAGYHPPASILVSWTGVANAILAPLGGFAINLAAITAAICSGKEADPNPKERYKASIWAGLFYVVSGIFGATVVALFAAFPNELVLTVAGLALLATLGTSLKVALETDKYRESALITFLVSASGINLLGIGAAFWGLVMGLLSLLIVELIRYKKR